ncbi:MAG: HlyD family secretion protein [Variibacter sp.]|jgi:HlyD family secretion protein|nr:HlyD family secretion protein [Variibacter sp.]
MRWVRRILSLVVILAALAGAAFYFFPEYTSTPSEPAYRLAKADRGPITAVVTATGTINPLTTVIVSSQQSGQVVEILADYNSEVKQDQVVARLNSDQIRAKLDAARADRDNLVAMRAVQEAQINRVYADIERMKATQADAQAQIARNEALLADTERAVVRQTELRQRGVTTEAAFETSRAQRDAQRASLDSARAQLASAHAQQAGFEADLKIAQAQLPATDAQIAQKLAIVRQIDVDLRNTDIRSPVQGVIVQRQIELGQTVAASLQAPTLFLIADDLRRMEIAANIDETDVGRIRTGQKVSFTVNAYPGRNFEGAVKQVRLGSQTVQNVVIYTTIISVENPRMELLPGMTANLRIETDSRENVVRVANAALRWRPPSSSPDAAPASAGAAIAAVGERGGGGGSGRGGEGGGGRGAIGEFVAAVRSDLGLTAAQKQELDAALADVRKGFEGLRGGGSGGDQEGRRAQFRELRAQLNDRIAAVLTAEQKPKFEELKARFAERAGDRRNVQTGRVFVAGANGKPEAMTVRLGVSDGTVTEIVSGLQPDQQVIVGGGPRVVAATEAAPVPARAGGPPRFGF